MWICPNCGMGNEDGHSYCTECGNPRPQTPSISDPAWEEEKPGEAAPIREWSPIPAPELPQKESRLPLIIALSVLGLAVLGLALFLFLGMGLGREARYRLIHMTFESYDGSTEEEIYSYTGSTGKLDSYEDGNLTYVSALRCNEDGYPVEEEYRTADGELVFRFEYGYDGMGNNNRIVRYTPEGKIDLLIERRYNEWRAIEYSESTYYDAFGLVDYRTIVEFSDRTNGVSYDLDARNQRTDNWVYRRTYDDNNNMTEEWCYEPDGEFFRVNLYQRDENHLVQNYTVRYYDNDESHYDYQYEKIR